MVIFAAYLAGIRVYDDTDVRVRQGSLTPIVVDFMYKRRVAEVLLDFCLVTLCYYVAYRLRFEDPEEFMKNFQMFTQLAADRRDRAARSRSSWSASIAACGVISG